MSYNSTEPPPVWVELVMAGTLLLVLFINLIAWRKEILAILFT